MTTQEPHPNDEHPRAVAPRVGLGCAALGNLFRPVAEEDAHAVVEAAWRAGVRYFDTAPLYGHGTSERRLGEALRGRPRHEYRLATKVGRLLVENDTGETSMFAGVDEVRPTFDFSRDGVLRSIESSLRRLGVDRLDVVMVHDPDDFESQVITEALPTLRDLQSEGVVGLVGCGMNQAAMPSRFVDAGLVDLVLLAGRYTLLDRSGEALLVQCADRGVEVVLGGIFNSGILVDPEVDATFDYLPADRRQVERAVQLRRHCRAHGVPLAAAALQFGLRHPAVDLVLVGPRSVAELEEDLQLSELELPDALWTLLESFGSEA